jgi:proline iminopeptidase
MGSMQEAWETLTDGARLWTCRTGRGVPTVLLGGGPGLADYLGPLAELLGDVCASQRFEPRGCGRSDRHGPYRLRRFVADIDELRMRSGSDAQLVIGHSWGADLALAYALTYPQRVLGLIGISGGRLVDDRSWSRIYHARRDREAAVPTGSPPNPEVNRALNGEWRAYCRRDELLGELSRLQTPALFLYGSDDIRPAWPTRQLGWLLPRGRFVEIVAADHYPWRGNGRAVKAAVAAFVETSMNHASLA